MADQDFNMNSSPTSSADNEDTDLFPESTGNTYNPASFARPQTPQNDHLNAAAPGELSPPRSQSQSHPDTDPPFASTNGHTSSGFRDGAADTQTTSSNGASGDAQTKPGSGWKTKRAQEEYQRAWDNVVDRDFNLREFGDVMAMLGEHAQ